jgi:ubiquinone/menaquinone biosynthesis C-methylase UbiE
MTSIESFLSHYGLIALFLLATVEGDVSLIVGGVLAHLGILPLVGGLVSGHKTAYKYLPDSVANFPETTELARRMTAAGFALVSWESLTLGIAAIHVGEKN